MPSYDATNAECRVFTFKEGLLSAVAHDLEIDVSRFAVEISDDGSSIEGTFEASSLRVVDPIVDGRRSPGALSDRDKRKIEGNIADSVLHPKKHREIRFTSTEVSETKIRGRLELHGRSRDVELRREGDTARVTLHQPDFGIKPFSAMLGTLKIKPRVDVVLTIKR